MVNPTYFQPPQHEVVDAVRRALAEDLSPLGDMTSGMIGADVTATAQINARKPGRLAGRACAAEAFRQVDESISITWHCHDGDELEAGTIIADVSGPLATILVAERTALNFLGHLSGIATRVNEFVTICDGRIGVWDTRKTTPGLRALEKAATRAGGGRNHRGNLSGWLMFKDNHLVGMTIAEAIAEARDRWPGRPLHVECDRLDQVEQAVAAHADLILLDNMSPDTVREAMTLIGPKRPDGRPIVEASGGITIETIGDYADTGVDFVSSGSLTNSAPVLDIGLDIEIDAVTTAD
jgi:nicotinate-nucleotide pyrophosphorylase (carboxylating)